MKEKPFEVSPEDVTDLRASEAELHGNIFGRERFWIEGWTSLEDSIFWKIKTSEAADYETALIYSCPTGSGGSEIEIAAGDSKVHGVVRETIGFRSTWNNFERVRLEGMLSLPPGVSRITIRATKKPSPPLEVMRLYSLELIPLAAKEAIAAAEARAKRTRASTDWFVDAKYGLTFHWTAETQPRRGCKKPFSEAVRDFDVNAFADMVEETGAGYVIFTSSHAIRWFPAPIQAIEKIPPGGRTTQRDLIGELADALNECGINLILYWPLGHPRRGVLQQMSRPMLPPDQYFDDFCDVFTEIGQRYGRKVAGYWFDGARHLTSFNPPWERMFEATKVGNPDRIIAYNAWIFPKLTDFQEYYAGEAGRHLYRVEPKHFEEGGPEAGLQPHIMNILDDVWVHRKPDTNIGPPIWKTDELIDYFRKSVEKKVVLSPNINIYQEGTVSPATLEQMRAIRKAIKGCYG